MGRIHKYRYLQFYIDDTLKDQISGKVDWTLSFLTEGREQKAEDRKRRANI